MEFKKVLLTRASCRAYTDQEVTEEELNAVLSAAQAAPVGMAAYQTVHLTVIRNQDFFDALNEAAAKFIGREGAKPLYGAPVMILVSAKPGMPPAIEFHNTGAIVENMHLMATDMGLGSVYIMGAVAALNANPELVQKLGLPEGFVPTAGIVIGHPVNPLKERDSEEKIEVNCLD